MSSIFTIEYELRTRDGKVIESSNGAPLRFVFGKGRMLPSLERRLAGLREGEEDVGVLPAAQAFGDPTVLPTAEVPRGEFEPDVPLSPGRRFEARTRAGEDVRFEIVAVGAATVTVRFLHPLADEDLTYWVRLLRVEFPPAPPPVPAAAYGIDSQALQIWDSKAIPV
jgi:FKBP-type peptidyl-prolyl cis-trans isomerase SlyD